MDFDNVINRRGTNSIKWDCNETIFGKQDILPMWVADMDFVTPKPVIDALKKRVEHGAFGYTIRQDSFYYSIVNWIEKRHQWTIKKEWICYSPGVVTSLAVTILCFTEAYDKILVQSPVYTPFFDVIRHNNRELVNNKLQLINGRYEVDFEDLEKKLKSGVKMMILCSPHNPVGRVWTTTELRKIGNLCIENDVLLVSDEIHADLIYNGYKHTPIASLSQDFTDNIITCMAPSKTFNIPGLSTSYVLIKNKILREKFNKFINNMHLGMTNVFGITALEAAYGYGEKWLDNLLVYIEDNKNYLMKYIKENIPGIKVIKSEGTYLVWLDFNNLGMKPDEIHSFLINKAGVGLNKGTDFGSGGEGFERMNIGCPRSILTDGVEKIYTAIKQR